MRSIIVLTLLGLSFLSYSQQKPLEKLLSDSALIHASLSIRVADFDRMENILEYNSDKSLTPASVLKLVTSACALEVLGPEYTFKTTVGYTGKLNKRTGKLTGDIVIRGGGDPALGSEYFPDYYKDFIQSWISEIKKAGIRKVSGRVITDDSYFDYNPVPVKWLIEDEGNYYGAGVYGLSVFDNTYEIHLNTADSAHVIISKIMPAEYVIDLTNNLTAKGSTDEGNILSVPYGSSAELYGTVPACLDDFVLKGSITDPPLLLAKITDEKLRNEGIKISEAPATFRSMKGKIAGEVVQITETASPPLSEIIKVLNHESVNLYAEHLIRELGKKSGKNGSVTEGKEVIKKFLNEAGIITDGMFIEDGSGLSRANSINSRELVNLLVYMKQKSHHPVDYLSSLPEAGKEGTLANYFKDEAFDHRLIAKSGSMTRVRSYAGYFTTLSGKNMVFSIIINNFSGPSRNIVIDIGELLKEIILAN